MLGAVAVVDVEIHDRDALGAVDRARVAGRDRGVVEEAEAHRRRHFGVMAGRAGRDEGVADLARHHLVDREDRAAGRAQRRLEGAGFIEVSWSIATWPCAGVAARIASM